MRERDRQTDREVGVEDLLRLELGIAGMCPEGQP